MGLVETHKRVILVKKEKTLFLVEVGISSVLLKSRSFINSVLQNFLLRILFVFHQEFFIEVFNSTWKI